MLCNKILYLNILFLFLFFSSNAKASHAPCPQLYFYSARTPTSLNGQEELALAIREARLANPSVFDEKKTWYRRHTNPHASEEWGTPQENWKAEALVVAEKRSRESLTDEVGLGDCTLWAATVTDDGGDY